MLSWLDMDDVVVDGHSLRLDLAGAEPVLLTHLAKARDDFVRDLRAARSPARRAALLQWGGTRAVDTFTYPEGEIHLFGEGLVVEPYVGRPTFVPFSLIERVERDGYTITLLLRVLPPVTVSKLARRTEEFLTDLDRLRAELVARTVAGYAEVSPTLQGFTAPDGWAIDAAGAGRWWGALRAAVAGQERAAEIDALEALAGDRLRLGIKVAGEGGGGVMPFALAPMGNKVAVEGTDTDARATFVFATEDVDQLNVALLLTNFRREAISLPQDQLGRWAVAARTLDVVRWARSALVARVVHDETWESKVTAALK